MAAAAAAGAGNGAGGGAARADDALRFESAASWQVRGWPAGGLLGRLAGVRAVRSGVLDVGDGEARFSTML